MTTPDSPDSPDLATRVEALETWAEQHSTRDGYYKVTPFVRAPAPSSQTTGEACGMSCEVDDFCEALCALAAGHWKGIDSEDMAFDCQCARHVRRPPSVAPGEAPATHVLRDGFAVPIPPPAISKTETAGEAEPTVGPCGFPDCDAGSCATCSASPPAREAEPTEFDRALESARNAPAPAREQLIHEGARSYVTATPAHPAPETPGPVTSALRESRQHCARLDADLVTVTAERDAALAKLKEATVRIAETEDVLTTTLNAARERAELEGETLRELLREVPGETGGHEHWDREMTRGANCPTCIHQRAFYERINAALAPPSTTTEPAKDEGPRWPPSEGDVWVTRDGREWVFNGGRCYEGDSLADNRDGPAFRRGEFTDGTLTFVRRGTTTTETP